MCGRGIRVQNNSMNARAGLLVVIAALACGQSGSRVPLRSRVEIFKGSGQWEPVTVPRDLDPSKTALVICDMWDHHWCTGAEDRVSVLARKMEPFIEAARKSGILIIHAPSETMAFYAQAPQRIKML